MEDRETLRSLIEQPVRQVDDEAGVPTPTEVAASWRIMGQRLFGRESVVPKGIGILGTQPLRRRAWASFGAVILGVFAFLVSWQVLPHFRERRPTAVQTYTTGDGQRANITLSDGSIVALNVASQLDVPVDYPSGDRTLRLRGEALFTVSHHEGNPLTVIAGPTTARVLGTSFVVRNYPTDSVATVVVREGRVAVQSVVLSAGRLAEVSHTGAVHVYPADQAEFSFASGVLTLKAVPLAAAIPVLDRWYGADIRLGSPALATLEMDGRLPAGSLTDLAALLEMTYDIRVVRDRRVLTLEPR